LIAVASRVALFDVDGVILGGKGLNLFARYLVSRGEAKPALAMRGLVRARSPSRLARRRRVSPSPPHI
jgi:hypothetical protein